MPKIYTLQTEQFIPVSLNEAWDFFSSPKNLSKITPDKMNFNIISDTFREKMYAGQIIQYTVSPLLGLKMHWVTEITKVEEKKMFIDEQRFGPYKFWHHQHHFNQVDGGVMMTDIINYAIPLGLFGRFLNFLFIGSEVSKIFEYRKKYIDENYK